MWLAGWLAAETAGGGGDQSRSLTRFVRSLQLGSISGRGAGGGGDGAQSLEVLTRIAGYTAHAHPLCRHPVTATLDEPTDREPRLGSGSSRLPYTHVNATKSAAKLLLVLYSTGRR